MKNLALFLLVIIISSCRNEIGPCVLSEDNAADGIEILAEGTWTKPKNYYQAIYFSAENGHIHFGMRSKAKLEHVYVVESASNQRRIANMKTESEEAGDFRYSVEISTKEGEILEMCFHKDGKHSIAHPCIPIFLRVE